jgi:hypothetical protein
LTELVESARSAQEMVDFFARLQPRYAAYERAAGIRSSSPSFRDGLTDALLQLLITVEQPQIRRKRLEYKRQMREPAKRADEARRMLKHPLPQGFRDIFEQEYERYHRDWFGLAQHYDALKGQRRPRKKAAEIFIRRIAALYIEATGRKPTISTNSARDPEHTGEFADLLMGIHRDVRWLIRRYRPDAVGQWTDAPVRYAKRLRLNR